jgi:sec-independent protein translocase protein TatA
MGSFSLIHWIILGLFLLLLFGGSRFSNMMKDVAKGMKSFKEGMADDEDEKRKRYEEQRRAEPPRLPRDQDPIDVNARREEPTAPPPPQDDEAR